MNQLHEGALLKQIGLNLVDGHNPDFCEIVRAHAMEISNEYGRVSVDDLRVWAKENDIYPRHCNAWGAIFRGPEWERIGMRQSQIPSNHARLISVWKYRGW